MSKAKDKAEDAYLDYFLDGRLRNCSRREAFIYGYCHAEKDLELSWKDIDWIVGEFVLSVSEDSVAEQIYKEVLKHFKNYKERKENGE
jgi:hypothetical protein